MEKTKVGRRELLTAGSVVAVGLTAAAVATPVDAASPDTPITDSLSSDHASLLTAAAAAITEGDAVLLNRSLRDPDVPVPAHLAGITEDDINSLKAAFQASHEQTFELSSLSLSLVGSAYAQSGCCCCCTPASCCCAAAQTVPTRSRRIA